MPVFRNSRYDGSSYIGLTLSDGKIKRWVAPQSPMTVDDISADWVEHVVEGPQDLDMLALAYGGKEQFWWMIAEVNNIMFPWDIAIGTRLIVPTTALTRRTRR